MTSERQNRKRAGKSRSQRQLRVGELIRHALSDILQRDELHDPVLHNKVITISEAQVSPDLRHATIFFSALSCNMPELADIGRALNRRTAHFRGQLGQQIQTKFTPQLKFVADDSFENAQSIDKLLRSAPVSRDLDS